MLVIPWAGMMTLAFGVVGSLLVRLITQFKQNNFRLKVTLDGNEIVAGGDGKIFGVFLICLPSPAVLKSPSI